MGKNEEPRKVSREVDVALTDDEKLDLGEQLAAVGMEIEQCNEKVRKINADKRPKVKLALELTRKLASGVEKRDLLCEVIEGPGMNIAFRRPDTGELFGERAMTPEERQLKIAGRDWLEATEEAAARGKQEAAGGGDGDDLGDDEDDDDGDNVVPFGGRSSAKKAARSPRKGGGKSKGRKR